MLLLLEPIHLVCILYQLVVKGNLEQYLDQKISILIMSQRYYYQQIKNKLLQGQWILLLKYGPLQQIIIKFKITLQQFLLKMVQLDLDFKTKLQLILHLVILVIYLTHWLILVFGKLIQNMVLLN